MIVWAAIITAMSVTAVTKILGYSMINSKFIMHWDFTE
jgi:hypothetical protein